jgi:general secretion pathway protein D
MNASKNKTQKKHTLKNKTLSALLLAALMAAQPVCTAEEMIRLNFVNAEIESAVRAIGTFTNKNFVVDPRVKGSINLQSQAPVNKAEAYNTLLAALRLQGFTIVEAGGIARVVPENDAKIQAAATDPRKGTELRGDQIVTQVFQLNYESATNLVPVLRPLIAPNNTIAAYPNNNTLVITDYADNLKRIGRIIASIDGPSANDLEIVPVKHALAIDLAGAVSRLLDEGARATGAAVDGGQRMTVLADARTNSLLIRTSSTARMAQAKNLIARLDQPTVQPGSVYVVYLKNAEAAKLAQTLRSVLSSDTSNNLLTNNSAGGNSSGGGLSSMGSQSGGSSQGLGIGMQGSSGGGGMGSSGIGGGMGASMGGASNLGAQSSTATGNSTPSTPGIVQADPTTNSLIITAPEPVYRNLRSIIDKLDVRRAQVFVESLIVEVSAEKAAQFGIQFQALSNVGSGGSGGFGGTNFGSRGGGNNILDAAANLGTVGGGLNVGIIKGQVEIPGLGTITNLGFLARALETNANANILSTPNLLTLDNEEARIIIGQNVPFVTGQFTATGTSAAVNPFQTIERRDVGLTLRVKPQVSEGGTVKLGIYQEVSSVQDRTQTAGIITNKRAIESNVIVDDGNIIVLGGLVEDRYSDTEEKVPGLGDLPGVGVFFRYDARKRVKTNLMVFLRPVVIRTPEQSNSLMADRYEYMRGIGEQSQPTPRFALPNEAAPIMPALKPFGEGGLAPAAPGKATQIPFNTPKAKTTRIDVKTP